MQLLSSYLKSFVKHNFGKVESVLFYVVICEAFISVLKRKVLVNIADVDFLLLN